MKNENMAFFGKLTAKRSNRRQTEDKSGSQVSRRKGIPDLIKYLANNNKEINNFLKNIKNKQKEKQKEEFTKKRLEVLFKFIFYIFSNIMNIISVFIYMLQTFFPEDNPENEAISLGLSYIELALTFYFLLEYILLAYRLKGAYFKHLISIDSFIDIITIVPSIIAYFISFRGVKLSFIRIFRIFRVFRVLRIYKSLRRIQNETAEDNTEDGPQGKMLKFDPIKLQFFTIVVILVCVFFIGAGLVLGMNDMIENAFSKKSFNFLDAIYFMIVTFSTLGYGDITPTNVTTRFMIIIGLFCLIIIVSDQMTKLANLLKFWGPGISAFHGQNHIIIIVDKTINIDMFINFLASRIPVKRDFIVISKDIPPYSYTFYPYNKTVVINTQNIDLELLDLINFKAASGIFIFSSKYLNNYEQYDKITDFFLMKLTQNFFQSNIYIQSLNTEKTLLNVVLNDRKKYTPTFQNLRKVVPIWKMKSLMIAKSSFNPGFSTFIQNLLYNYTPKPSNILEYSEIIQNYIHGTENKMLVFKLSEFFKGRDFYDVMYMIYFKSISQYFYKINTVSDGISVFLLVGVYEKNMIDRYTEDDLEIFPNNYEITSSSCGVFIGPFNQSKRLEEIMNEFDSLDSEAESQTHHNDIQSKGKKSLLRRHHTTSKSNKFSINRGNKDSEESENRNDENSSEISSSNEQNSKNKMECYENKKTKKTFSNSSACDSSYISVTSQSCELKSNSNSDSKSNSDDSNSNKTGNNNFLTNLNRRVSHKNFIDKRMNSLNPNINLKNKFSKKTSNNKQKEKYINEFPINNSKTVKLHKRDNPDKIFDSNTYLNKKLNRINKTFKRSSSSIDKTKQSENFKNLNNENLIFKKYKSSTIDTKKINKKNLYIKNNDKINLEMKINICNQDKYFNNGNLNINLNLNTYVNNNNFPNIPENIQENRDDSRNYYSREQDRTISINNLSRDTQKTNSIQLNSSYYSKKSDLIINNNNKCNFSSDSLDSSKEKNKNIFDIMRKSNITNKEKSNDDIKNNEEKLSSKNRIKNKDFILNSINKKNKSVKKISFKSEAENKLSCDEKITDNQNNLLLLNENQSSKNFNKNYKNSINKIVKIKNRRNSKIIDDKKVQNRSRFKITKDSSIPNFLQRIFDKEANENQDFSRLQVEEEEKEKKKSSKKTFKFKI